MPEVRGSGSVIRAPQPGSQTLFLTCPHFECLYEGTRGPGKTEGLLMDYGQHVGQGHGRAWRGILFRRTYKQLKDIESKAKRWFWQVWPDAKFNEQDHVWKWPTGEELLFSYMDNPDDYWNYHGHEYPWIGWEELTNWANLDCYEAMKSCCRSSVSGMPRKYRATCNPFGRGHNAVKAYFIDPAPAGVPIQDGQGRTRVRLFGSIYENKILMEADPDYLKNIEAITDENKRRAWLFGDWDISSGGALDDVWDRNIHVLQPFKVPSSWHVDRSFDWGGSKPFSLGLWARSDGTEAVTADGAKRIWPRGTLFRIGEWYGCQKDAAGIIKANAGLNLMQEDLGRGIWEREKKLKEFQTNIRHIAAGPADSSMFVKQDGESIYDKIQAGFQKAASGAGGTLFFEANKAPGTRKHGLELLRSRLKASLPKVEHGIKLPMEIPGLYVFDSCTDGWLRTVPCITRDDDDPDDVDSEAEDHAYDETRYELMHKPASAGTIRITGV